MNKDISLVVMTCDSYDDIWKPFFDLKNKYWKKCPYETYLITETKDSEYAKTIKTTGSWTKRLREALEKIDTKYVLFMLDDFFIRDYVDQQRIEAISMQFNDNTACFNFEITNGMGELKSGLKGFNLKQNKSPYLNSCQPSIHDRLKLIERLQEDQTPWQWEMTIVDSPYEFYINNSTKIIDNGQEYEQLFGMVRGKWCLETYKFLKSEGFDLDFHKRGFFKGSLKENKFNPKLSIVIPYYKVWDLCSVLLENLCSQLTDEVEIIVADDGCGELRLNNYPINVIHSANNGGLSYARNLGIAKATGDYITFIDADDNVSTEYISKIIDKINTSEFDYCMFSWKFTGDKDEEVIITGEPPEWNVSVWNCVYKRSIIGKFDERVQIIEDSTFNNAYRKGKRENIPDILYHYLWGRKDSLTQKHARKEIGIEFKGDGLIKTQIVIYRSFLSKIGGIETAVYNLCEALKDKYNIIFVYDTVDQYQLNRLSKLVKCVQYKKQKFKCGSFIYYGMNPQEIENTVFAQKYIQQICCDVRAINYDFKISKKTTHITADSQASAEAFTRVHKVKCGVLHNLFNIENPKRCLNLMSATRLSNEKGYVRMKKLAKKLIEKNIPFEWTIFTNDVPDEKIDGFIFRSPKLNVIDYMSNKDYILQLSDTESWGCTVTESLECGTPVICTDYPSATEQVEDGVNGFILKRDMSNLDSVIDKMYNTNIKKFKYNKKYNIKEWEDILGDLGEKNTDYIYIPEIKENEVTIKAIKRYEDYNAPEKVRRNNVFLRVYNNEIQIGDVYKTSQTKAESLVNSGLAKYI